MTESVRLCKQAGISPRNAWWIEAIARQAQQGEISQEAARAKLQRELRYRIRMEAKP